MPMRLTRAVKALLIIYFVVFLIQQTVDQFFGGHILELFALVPSEFFNHHSIWQLFTYSFLHADVMHLFLNLLMLAFMGGEIEAAWGTARFLRYYFFCATAGGVFYLLLQLLVWRADVPMVGASGAIYGLLMAYGLIFGERVLLFMMLFPMKAKHFVWVLAGVEFLSSVFSGRGGLASIAHLGGMAAGFGLLWGRAAWTVAKRGRAEKLDREERARRVKNAKLKLVVGGQKKDGPWSVSEDDPDDHPKTWH